MVRALLLGLVLVGCGGADLHSRGGGSGSSTYAGSWGGETALGYWAIQISFDGAFVVDGVGSGTINNLGFWNVAGVNGRMTIRGLAPSLADLTGGNTGVVRKKVAY